MLIEGVINFKSSTGGGVDGDNSSVSGNLPVFGDTTGKKIVDSGVSLTAQGILELLDLSLTKDELGIENNSRIVYVDSNGDIIGLTLGTNLSISGTTLNASGGAGSADWGSIGGTLADQSDLVTALGSKVDEGRALQNGTGIASIGDLSADRTISLANMAQATLKGRASGAGTGAPGDLTATQVRTILNVADGADVVGPDGVTANRVAVYDGETGKLLKDGGQTIAEIIAASGGTPTYPSWAQDGGEFVEGVSAPLGTLIVTTAVLDSLDSADLEEAEGWLIFEDESVEAVTEFNVYPLEQGSQNFTSSTLALSGIPLSDGNLPSGVSIEEGDTILAVAGARRSTLSALSGLSASGAFSLSGFTLHESRIETDLNQAGVSIASATVGAVSSGDTTITSTFGGSTWQAGVVLYLVKGAITAVGTASAVNTGTSIALDIAEVATSGDVLVNGIVAADQGSTITPPAGITANDVMLQGGSNVFAMRAGTRDDNQDTEQEWTITDNTGGVTVGAAILVRAAA